MRVIFSVLLFFGTVHVAQSYELTCREFKKTFIKWGTINAVYDKYCVSYDNTTYSKTLDIIHFKDNTTEYSLREIASNSDNGGCKTFNGDVQVVLNNGTADDITCDTEITILIATHPRVIEFDLFNIVANTSFLRHNYTVLTSVYGGIRLDQMSCYSEGGSVNFYSGFMDSNVQNPFTTYPCNKLPITYVAFENVISILPVEGTLVYFTASNNIHNGAALGTLERAAVASSEFASDVNDLRPDRNFAMFPLIDPSVVRVIGNVRLDNSYNGSILISSKKGSQNESRLFTIYDYDVDYSFQADSFEVRFVPSPVTQYDPGNRYDFIDINFEIRGMPYTISTPVPPSSPTVPCEQTTALPGTAQQKTTPQLTTQQTTTSQDQCYCSCSTASPTNTDQSANLTTSASGTTTTPLTTTSTATIPNLSNALILIVICGWIASAHQ